METLRDRPWHRHDLVWVTTAHCAIAAEATDGADARDVMDAAGGAGAADADDAADRTLIAAWIDARRPFVVRCQGMDCKTRNVLAVGLPLPPSQGKRRVALETPLSSIERSSAPLALRDAVDSAPPGWREPLSQLHRLGVAAGVEFRVFGSLAWQALTGLAYVNEHSDLDLCWRPRSAAHLDTLSRLLASWQQATGIAVDGEIVFDDDHMVSWREWQLRRTQAGVLVKRLHGPVMRTPSSLLAMLGMRSPAVAPAEHIA
jgi:phosphoribosyl-dephospho-CoA transferase